MKVRIGVGVGGGATDPTQLGEVCDQVVAGGLDSLWLSEVLTGPVVDPLVALSWAAGRNSTLKLGTTMLVAGRNPMRLAKSLASLDRLSAGRLLITLVPGLTTVPERGAVGPAPADRGAITDEVIPLLRRLWAGETVTWRGAGVDLEEVRLTPTPVQDPLEIWLGGMAPAALRRCGRLGDGWLPSLCTPETASDGRQVIEKAAGDAGRQISDEHFGVSIGYSHQPLSDRARAAIAARGRGVDPDAVVPVGWDATRALLEDFVKVGFTKFVLRPMAPPDNWPREIAAMADAVSDLQT
jgi:probable F420-dependent oxidoreductase